MEKIVTNTESFKTISLTVTQPPEILLIGSSTGGLNALSILFQGLKNSKIDIPILITQHIPNNFDHSFIKKIENASGLNCKIAEQGEEIKKGCVYMAPSSAHMKLKQTLGKVVIDLDDGEEVNFCKPAVDPMLFSASTIYKHKCFVIILTGIGSDGLKGSQEIQKLGGTVIAQDKETSVVWGMPGAVAKEGICSAILNINKIAEFLKEYSFGRIR